MRLPRVVFLGTTFGLGLACAYLVNQLDTERGRTRAEADQRRLLETRIHELERALPRVGSRTAAEEAPGKVSSATSPAAVQGQAPGANSEDSGHAYQRYRSQALERLSDPDARALLRTERQAEVRRSNRGLSKALGLNAAEEDRLTERLAEQNLKREEFNARSPVEGNSETAVGAFEQAQRDELSALLGDEKVRRLERFQASMPERTQMDALRARLDGANGLSDEQESQLIARMQQERTAYLEGLKQEGVSDTSSGVYPFSPESTAADPASHLALAEASLAKTESFLRKIHDQAATVLSGEQLRRFDELQEEQLNWERMKVQSLRALTIKTADTAAGSRTE